MNIYPMNIIEKLVIISATIIPFIILFWSGYMLIKYEKIQNFMKSQSNDSSWMLSENEEDSFNIPGLILIGISGFYLSFMITVILCY